MPMDRLDLTLLVLVALTLGGLVAVLTVPSTHLVDGLLLGASVVKGRQLVLNYLGLREAPALWRRLIVGWVFAVAVLAAATVAIGVLI